MYRYINKLVRSNLKFYIALVKLFVNSSEFRSNISLDKKLINLEKSAKDIRKLLKLKPTWGRAHFLLGLLSHELYLNSKDPYYLGVIEISADALDILKYDKSNIMTLRLCLDFLRGQYLKINALPLNEILSKPDSSATSYLDILRLELLGSSFLAVDNRENAKKVFSKIHPARRSQEVRVAFLMFEAIPSSLS